MADRFGLPERTLKTIQELLARYPGIDQAVVYGSRANGNYRPGSDIDLTLLTDSRFTHSHLAQLRMALDDSDIPYLVDVSIFSELRNPDLLDHIRRVGKPLVA
jgi:predicted nucleotidyltransferase